MLLIVGSWPKSGSTWIYHCVDKILEKMGCGDAKSILHKYGVSRVVNEYNNPGYLSKQKIESLLVPHLNGEWYAVKSHEGPDPNVIKMIDRGICHVSFIVRHPLDIVVSTMDYGKRLREIGDSSQPYWKIHTIDQAILFLDKFWDRAVQWNRCNKAFILKYEEILSSPPLCLEMLMTHYGVASFNKDIGSVVGEVANELSAENIRNGLASVSADRIRFNQGSVGRYKDVLSDIYIRTLSKKYGNLLNEFEYDMF